MQTFSLLFSVLWSPGAAFKEIAERPRIIAPLAALVLFALITAGAVFQRVDPGTMALKQLERMGRLEAIPQEQRALILERSRATGPRAIGFVFSAIGPVLVVTFITAIFFGLFTLFGWRERGFKAFLSATAFALMPTNFRQLAATAMVLSLPPDLLALEQLGNMSLSAFLDSKTVPVTLYVAAGLLDLVSIWTLALLVIGFGAVSRPKVSAMSRTIVVVGLFAVYGAIRVGIAAIAGF